MHKMMLRNIVGFVAVMMLLSGCHAIEETQDSREEHNTNTEAITDGGGGTSTEAASTVQEEAELTLVFAVPPYQLPDSRTEQVLNDYLEEQGCEYRVRFISMIKKFEDFAAISTADYAQQVENYISEGNQVDLFAATNTGDSSPYGSYEILLEDGYLTCLDSYMNSEMGQRLYQSMPQTKWESVKTDGKLYGINGYPIAAQTDIVYAVNKELMQKYNLAEEDLNRPFSELTELLEQIQQSEGKGFCAVFCSERVYDVNEFCGLYALDQKEAPGLVLDEDSSRDELPLISILEDEAWRSWMKELYEVIQNPKLQVRRQESYTEPLPNYEEIFMYISSSELPIHNSIGDYFLSCDSKRVITAEDFCWIYPYSPAVRIRDRVSHTVLLDASAHKEEAFDFLCRLYADSYLSDLLSYGTEFDTSDGYVVDEKGSPIYSALASWVYANAFISSPEMSEPKDKAEQYNKIYEDAYVSKYAGFFAHTAEYSWEIAQVRQILEQMVEDIWISDIEDFDVYLDECLQEYWDVGGKVLFEAVKEQWLEFAEGED